MQLIFTKSSASDDAAPSGAPPAVLTGTRYFSLAQRADGNSLVPSGGIACNFIPRDGSSNPVAGIACSALLWLWDPVALVWFAAAASAVSVTCGTQIALRTLAQGSTLIGYLQITGVSGGAPTTIDVTGDPIPSTDVGGVASGGGGGGITALTGNVTASGTGSVVATIAAGAVTTARIAALAVTTGLLAANAVTHAKVDSSVYSTDTTTITLTGAMVALSLRASGLGAGIAHVDGSGNFTSSTIATGDIAASAVTSAKVDASVIVAAGTNAFTGDQSFGSHKATNLANGSAAQDAATYGQLTALVNGKTQKDSVLVLSKTNLTLSGEQTIDSVLTSLSRVAVFGQTIASQNGIYTTGPAGWTRTIDYAVGSSAAGTSFYVESGTVYGSTGWVCTTAPGSDVVGTGSLSVTQDWGTGTFTAGSGLTLTGTQFSIGATQVVASMLAAAVTYQLTGDVTAASTKVGASATSTVTAINGTTVPASPGTGAFLRATNSTTAAWATLTVGDLPHGTSGQIPVTNSGATACAFVSMSGDGTLSSTGVLAITQLTGSSSLVSVPTASLTFGATPAAALGTIRFPDTGNIYSRNHANSGDVLLLSKDTSDTVQLGATAVGAYVQAQASGTLVLAGGSTQFVLSGTTAAWAGGTFTSGSRTQGVIIQVQDRVSDAALATAGTQVRGQSAWASAATNVNGGVVSLVGGAPTLAGTTGLRGGAYVAAGTDTGSVLVETAEVVLGNMVLNLCALARLNSTDMPANSGNGVAHLANAATAPTANPGSGSILYAAAGAMKARGSAGTTTTLAAA